MMWVSRCSLIKVSKSCELFIVQLCRQIIININIIYEHYLAALLYACFIALTNVLCIIKLEQCFINSSFVLVRVWWIIWRLSPNCFYRQLKNGQSRTRKYRFVVYDLHKGNFCTMRTKQNYCTLYSHYTIVQYIMYIILYIMMSISETDQ